MMKMMMMKMMMMTVPFLPDTMMMMVIQPRTGPSKLNRWTGVGLVLVWKKALVSLLMLQTIHPRILDGPISAFSIEALA